MLQITSHLGLAASARTRLMMSPGAGLHDVDLDAGGLLEFGDQPLDDVRGMRGIDADALLRAPPGRPGNAPSATPRATAATDRSFAIVFSPYATWTAVRVAAHLRRYTVAAPL